MIYSVSRILLPGVFFTLSSLSSASDSLAKAFRTPSAESRPETWFHLIGGNVSKAGLSADLEAVADAGIRGIQLFHGGSKRPPWPGVEPQIECLSPSWDDMIRHTVDECVRLNLRFTMQNCPGWAMSGGPWITPENAMRHLVWSRMDIVAGEASTTSLPLPNQPLEPWHDYRDVAVIAFPATTEDDAMLAAPARVHGHPAEQPWAEMIAGKNNATVGIAAGMNEQAWVEIEFDQPVTIRSLELPPVEKLAMRRIFDPEASIHVQAWMPAGLVEVARREIPRSNWQDDRNLTLALPETTAKIFRFTFANRHRMELTRFRLSSAARIDNWEGQAGFVLRSLDRGFLPAQDSAAWVRSETVLDLSDRMDSSGKLDWAAPSGKWTVLRFGHVNTGAKNHPAPPEATGFECDKLSADAADAHFAGYIGRISGPGGPAGGGRLEGMLIDSWECRAQTWTPAMEQEFAVRRGYPMRKWLPALAGWVVDDHLTSQRFLRDWRATFNDLLVANYYGRLAELGRERGMTLSFEAGPGDVAIGDILEYYREADIPMCEFWLPNDPHWGGLETKPTLPAVSAAHLYGKKRIAAEAFTNINTRWDEHPFMLKHAADRHFSMGVTHLIFHTYTHNPRLDLVPGTTFGSSIGTPFLRGQTWWPHMPAFTEYLARCGFMLEQGLPVTDILWYLGDDLDHKPMQNKPFPAGYQYSYLNQDALINRLTVKDGLITSPEGITWKVLWLPNHPRLAPETLVRLQEMIHQGATVVGKPSLQNPTLVGGLAGEALFVDLIDELWGGPSAKTGDRRIGAGRLLWGSTLDAALVEIGMVPDVIGAKSASWCHRTADGVEIYFIAADRESPLKANLSFRSHGRPEFWDPLTGLTRPVGVFEHGGHHTVIPMDLPAAGSVFVIFHPDEIQPIATRIDLDHKTLIDTADASRVDRGDPPRIQGLRQNDQIQPYVNHDPAAFEFIDHDGKQLVVWQPGEYRLFRGRETVTDLVSRKPHEIPMNRPWSLTFPRGWGVDEPLDLERPIPWSDLSNSSARVFSGTATYSSKVQIGEVNPDMKWMLDLGRVSVIAGVKVNGSQVATLWAPPFRVDITPYISKGENQIDVDVTSTWFNRLVHDASQPEDSRKTWTINGPKPDSPLEPAGLIGPVKLRQGEVLRLSYEKP